MNFTDKQLAQIENKGMTLKKVNNQINQFKQGLPFINLHATAIIGHGILQIADDEKASLIEKYDKARAHLAIMKFVPASGAATRMFKFLFKFLADYKPEKESINSYINRKKASEMAIFFVAINKFPFYYKVKQQLHKKNKDFDKLKLNEQLFLFVDMMLDESKINYSNYPKGLLPFHQYRDHVATAFEEHLFEGAIYASSNGLANLHFTISEKHKNKFDEEFKRIEEIVERKTKTNFKISFSYQKESTDTIAVTPDNEPYVEEDGSLLFRPSGHGSLIENLNDLDSDIIFIKNIDNVVVSKYKKQVSEHKKILAGKLLELQEQAFQYLNKLETDTFQEEGLLQIAQFLSSELNIVISNEFEKYSKKYQKQYLFDKLNRPMRVCGMVKNEGEPGGGPFWVKDESAQISLQIVESAQIEKKIKHQKQILKSASHFNPVDLVCGIKDYKGNKFDLTKYVDPKTAFITMKTKVGKDIKALELPGLWNGSMANWNTIFVEVPLITFNPVKTVNDLLKAPHQVI